VEEPNMKKEDAIARFVKDNYKLLREEQQFEKKKYRDIKRAYFGEILKFQFGNPPDKEICNALINVLIKTKKIPDENALQRVVEEVPFLKMNNIKAEKYGSILDLVSKKYAIIKEVNGLETFERVERELEFVKKEKGKEIEDYIIQKTEEYRRLPSILDDTEFEEPSAPVIQDMATTWWEDLNLKENPFLGSLDGFGNIDRSLHEQLIVETPPIKWALDKLDRNPNDIFHKGYLLAGDFGTGKTTFYDFLAPHLTSKLIEPIRVALTENINEAYYNQKFEKEICMQLINITRRFNLTQTKPLIDFDEARIHMMDIQKSIRGFCIFIDDLHKHSNLNLVLRFLSQLQIVKNNFSRDGINVAFIVAGFPIWRDKIKEDTALTGFFDAAEQLTMPDVTPALAAQAIKKRLQAFALNPSKELAVKDEFLTSIFQRVRQERGVSNIGFRPYIHEAHQRFKQKQFNILTVDFTHLDESIAKKIKAILENNKDFSASINKLIYGGGIQRRDNREATLRVVCEIFLRKGVAEEDECFTSHEFEFKKLSEAGLIQKYDRQTEGEHTLVWKVCPFIEKLNKEIISQFQLSIEDYLIPVYLVPTSLPKKGKDQTKLEIYEQDLKKMKRIVEPHIFLSISKALDLYSKHIFSTNIDKSLSSSTLPTIEELEECIWTMMKSIIRYESPTLLGICGESNIRGWTLRHASLQSSDYFVSLLKSAETDKYTLSDHTRLVSFADESFSELWDEFKKSIDVYGLSGVTCFMLPKKALRIIYGDFNILSTLTIDRLEYFESLTRFVEMVEHLLRQYLFVSSSLIFGPHHARLKQYPEDIRKYITKKIPSISTSYEAYNEFENLNRGQYRALFVSSIKTSPFFRYIIRPVIMKWDAQDIDCFFENFGNLNIVTSHRKIGMAEETKRNIPTFFRLACRLIADISLRLKDLLIYDNSILKSNGVTHVVFGYGTKGYTSGVTIIGGSDERIPGELYRHDITEVLSSGTFADFPDYSDNIFGCVELDLLEVEETRIKFGREYLDTVSAIALYLKEGKLMDNPLYGPSVWLKKQKV